MNKLKSILEERKMSQKDLAELSENNCPSINRYVNSGRVPNVVTALKIAKALGLTYMGGMIMADIAELSVIMEEAMWAIGGYYE